MSAADGVHNVVVSSDGSEGSARRAPNGAVGFPHRLLCRIQDVVIRRSSMTNDEVGRLRGEMVRAGTQNATRSDEWPRAGLGCDSLPFDEKARGTITNRVPNIY